MKALVLTEYNNFQYKEMPKPAIGDDEVLIAVKACGICGSDVHGADGSTGRRQPPIIMGHEAAGVIAETGKDVARWSKGDRVTFDSTIYCGECCFCQAGQVNLCDKRRVLGVSCDDYRQHGAFTEYVAVSQRILYRLPDAVSFAQAAMVEPVSIALHAVGRTQVEPNDTAVVVGTGMIGLFIVQTLRATGCGWIVAVDIDQDRLDMACTFGADIALRSDLCDVPSEVLKHTDGLGANVAFEAVGIDETISAAVASVRKGGTVVLVGNVSPAVELPLQAVVTRQISIHGSCASCGEYPQCLDMIANSEIDVDSLISAEAPLADGASWFKRLHAREKGLMKVILVP
ncbi:MAG: galactitol-1-phosphate 5-dehydrogenase [Planctomycetes bacterium]|nr:galactitol-1-phosphate 5-dehydrogenase [Planctomycetota bacterium]